MRNVQNDADTLYMRMAVMAATLSVAERKKVGAVLVLTNGLICHGWNSMPEGFSPVCEHEGPDGLVTNAEVLHAEDKVFDMALRAGASSEGSTLYVTMSPCLPCAKRILGAGTRRVVWLEDYRGTEGVDFLTRAGVQLERISSRALLEQYQALHQ